MSAHTAGPWEMRLSGDIVAPEAPYGLATLLEPATGRFARPSDTPRVAANGALLAAAWLLPEMLAALEMLVAAHGCTEKADCAGCLASAVIERYREAIR